MNKLIIKSSLFRSCLLLIVLQCALSSALMGQDAKVTINAKSARLETVLQSIQKQTGYKVFYSDNSVDPDRIVTVEIVNVPVSNLLSRILPALGLTYKFVDNTIVLSRDPNTKVVPGVVGKATPIHKVSGIVKDEKGTPMVGVSVVAKSDTRRGTTTMTDGRFQFNVPTTETHIIVSMIGMETQTIPVADNLNVTMKTNVFEAEEVIVTGYVPKAKNSFTGTATQVTGEQLIRVNPTNLLSALKVFDPSFVISDMNGMFGSNPNYVPERIEIRGSNSMPDVSENTLKTYTSLPIFILDGFQIEVEQVYDLDINRVENISILKDAAAASIYGSRAANGVVVITTKMPTKGAIQVSYTFNGSVEMPDLSSYNLMNSKELVQYYDKMNLFTDTGNLGGSTMVDPERRNLLMILKQEANNGIDTYWLSQPLRTSIQHQHSLFLEGGTDVGAPEKQRSVRYQVNFNASLQNGVMKGSDRNTYGGSAKLIYDTRKLQISNELQASFTDSHDSPYGDFSQYSSLLPIFRIKDENGNYYPTLSIDNVPLYDGFPITDIGSKMLGTQINPLYEANYMNNISKKESNKVAYKLGVNWEIIPDLRLRGTFSINHSQSQGDKYVSPLSKAVTDELGTSLDDLRRRGSYDRNYASSTDYYGMVNLSYVKSIGRHTVQAVAGGELKESSGDSDAYQAIGFLNDPLTDPGKAVQFALNTGPTGSSQIVRTVGAFATVNYGYDERYMFDASYRLDGSSNFAGNKRISPFWAVGVRWNLHNEKFMDNSFFDKIAIKANMGTTGNANFSLDQIQTMYKYIGQYEGITGAEIRSLSNPNLKWQTKLERTVGLELGLLKNIINLEFNYYSNTTKDNLTSISILPSTGFSTYWANMGEVSNKGYEFNLSVTPYKTKDWQVNFFVNGTHNKNKVVKISDALKEYNKAVIAAQNDKKGSVLENVFLFEEGMSNNSIYAVRSLGIDPGTGQEIFLTKSGEKTFTWNAADQVIVGCEDPTLYGFFGLNLSYRRWSFNTSFEYSFGGDMYNSTLAARVEDGSINSKQSDKIVSNVDRRALTERWANPGDIAKFRGINSSSTVFTSSRFVQTNNYMKINSMKLMYTLNQPGKKIWGMSMLRVALSTNELLHVSSIRQERGYSYPYARRYTLSLQANF